MKLFPLITFKRRIEELIMWPFVEAGRRYARRKPLGEEYDIFFFFPFYVLGGAEKVNAQIVACFPDKKVVIFFTRHSVNDKMLHLFRQQHARLIDISHYTDNKFKYWSNLFYRGVCAEYIDRQQKKPVVFNGQCNFAYKLFPHLKPGVLKLELIHTSWRHFSLITIPYVPFIDKRVMVADSIMNDHKRLYDELGLPAKLKERMTRILYQIDPPPGAGPRTFYSRVIEVGYAGRGGHQKRVWLIDQIARECIARKLPVHFQFAGNFKNELSPEVLQHARWHGELPGGEAMNNFHRGIDILLMTSAFEGFPLVIMEGMVQGVVPLVTAVDGIREHLVHGENGMLIADPDNESAVVRQGVEILEYLCREREHLASMSAAAFNYASTKFSPQKFRENYRLLFGME